VTRGGSAVVVLLPEKRLYSVEGRPTTEAAIHPTVLGDLYAVIGDPEGKDGGFVTRLYFNPLVSWIWAGVLIMVAGGVVSLSDRRHRVGAPGRRPLPADAAAIRA
jgi:cytochrome c-type biogenesis protein CcmF